MSDPNKIVIKGPHRVIRVSQRNQSEEAIAFAMLGSFEFGMSLAAPKPIRFTNDAGVLREDLDDGERRALARRDDARRKLLVALHVDPALLNDKDVTRSLDCLARCERFFLAAHGTTSDWLLQHIKKQRRKVKQAIKKAANKRADRESSAVQALTDLGA